MRYVMWFMIGFVSGLDALLLVAKVAMR